RRQHTIFKCDWSSDVCSSDLWDYERAVGGRNTTRCKDMVYPDGTKVKFTYGVANKINDNFSRVYQIQDGSSTPLATYSYNGTNQIERASCRQRMYDKIGTI